MGRRRLLHSISVFGPANGSLSDTNGVLVLVPGVLVVIRFSIP